MNNLLMIHVIPDNVDINQLSDSEYIGRHISSSDKILINRMSYGYSVTFLGSTIINASLTSICNTIIKLMSDNLPNEIFTVEFAYMYFMKDPRDEEFDEDVFKQLCFMQSLFNAIVTKNDHFNINISSYMKIAYNRIKLLNDKFDDHNTSSILWANDKDDDDEEDEYDDDLHLFEDANIENIKRTFEEYGIDLPFNELNDMIDKKSKEKSKVNVSTSRILTSANNPKKSYNRHGVIVVKGRKAIEKDEKIIKAFLKEFIPGNAQWKKDLRRDLCRRWLNAYVVTSKDLKQLEKHYKKKQQKKRNYDINRSLELTRRLLTVPVDKWNDPNR